MARQSFHVLPNRPALLIAVAAMLLATACGGGGSGTVQVRPEPAASLETRLDTAGIKRITLHVADATAEIDFQTDSAARISGRLELVEDLNRCLTAGEAGCARAQDWLFMGEYDGRLDPAQAANFKYHRTAVSIAIRVGAGDIRVMQGDVPHLFNDNFITSVNSRNAIAINDRISMSSFPDDAWVNWSRSSSFSPSYGGFNTELLRTSSVVVAISAGNFGSDKPYTQSNGKEDLDIPDLDAELSKAVRNTSVLFVYGLNDAATDIHPRSSRCGSRVMRVCIGVIYSYDLFPGNPLVNFDTGETGTSFSTALLSGTAWAMKSRWKDLTARQIAQIMLASARPLHEGDAPADEITGVGALDFTALFEPVGPLAAKELGSDDLALERGFLHLPGLTDFDNPQGVDSFGRNFQLATSTLAIQPGFADFDLDRFTPAGPGSQLHLAVRKRTGGVEDAALAFGHTNKLVLSSRYIGLCRDGRNTDLCLATTRREDFFGGQGSGSFRLEDTTYTSFAATHRLPIRDRMELGLSAAVTEARTSGKHLVGDVEGRLLQAELSLRSEKDTRSRKSSTSMSIWASWFDGAMELLGRQNPLTERSAGIRLRWQLDF